MAHQKDRVKHNLPDMALLFNDVRQVHGPAVQLFPVTGEAKAILAGAGNHEGPSALRARVLSEPVPVIAL